jgi:hypothetical protein
MQPFYLFCVCLDLQTLECFAKETEVLGEHLHECRFVHHRSHNLGSNPGNLGGKPATNCLNSRMAWFVSTGTTNH